MSTVAEIERLEATAKHMNVLSSHVSSLLHKGYNIRDVCKFKELWPDHPWWMIDFWMSRPHHCRYANDLHAVASGYQCNHIPACCFNLMRCVACDSDQHFAFGDCPVVDAIQDAMLHMACTDEILLMAFAKHSFDAHLQAAVASTKAAIAQRHMHNAWAYQMMVERDQLRLYRRARQQQQQLHPSRKLFKSDI